MLSPHKCPYSLSEPGGGGREDEKVTNLRTGLGIMNWTVWLPLFYLSEWYWLSPFILYNSVPILKVQKQSLRGLPQEKSINYLELNNIPTQTKV